MNNTAKVPRWTHRQFTRCICVASAGILAATVVVAPPDHHITSNERYAVRLTATQASTVAAPTSGLTGKRQPAAASRVALTPTAAESGSPLLEQAPGVIVFAVLFFGPILLAGAVGTVIWALSLPVLLVQEAARWLTRGVSGNPSPTTAAAAKATNTGSAETTTAHSARPVGQGTLRNAAGSARSILRRPADAVSPVRPSAAARSSRTSAASSPHDSGREPTVNHSTHRSTGASARPARGLSSPV